MSRIVGMSRTLVLFQWQTWVWAPVAAAMPMSWIMLCTLLSGSTIETCWMWV
jgi:hypothetical protein